MILKQEWGVRYTEDPRGLRENLEEVRDEYDERLNRINDEDRMSEIREDIEAIDALIKQLKKDPDTLIEQLKKEHAQTAEDKTNVKAEENAAPSPVDFDFMIDREGDEKCRRAEKLLETDDYEDGIDIYKKLAGDGNFRAMLRLSVLYDTGYRIYRDRKKALAWMDKIYKAVDYDPDKLMAMGIACYNGDYAQKDNWQAHHLFVKADECGAKLEPKYIDLVAWDYKNGKNGIEKNIQLAVDWYVKEGQAGDPDGYKWAGDIYYFGEENFPPDQMQASAYYREGANNGSVRCFYDLGYAYQYGQGVAKDPKRALKYIQEGADKGDAAAMEKLGNYYENGFAGLEQNYEMAANCFRDAINAATERFAVTNAQNDLGLLYLEGKGVPKLYDRAMEYFKQAEDAGDKYAPWNIGRMYDNGWGVDRDINQARAHMQIAADRGHQSAAEWLKKNA